MEAALEMIDLLAPFGAQKQRRTARATETRDPKKGRR